jgi:hypothetical protein
LLGYGPWTILAKTIPNRTINLTGSILAMTWSSILFDRMLRERSCCGLLHGIPRGGHLDKECEYNFRRKSDISSSHKVTYGYNEISQWSVGVTSLSLPVGSTLSRTDFLVDNLLPIFLMISVHSLCTSRQQNSLRLLN